MKNLTRNSIFPSHSFFSSRAIQAFVFALAFLILSCGGSGAQTKQEPVQSAKKETKRKDEHKNAEQHRNDIPEKVYKVLEYVRANHRAPEGYSGGRRFGNYAKRLPLKDSNGKAMKFQEWDVNLKKHGKNRGAERLITSENDRAWYTRDHYESFIEIR